MCNTRSFTQLCTNNFLFHSYTPNRCCYTCCNTQYIQLKLFIVNRSGLRLLVHYSQHSLQRMSCDIQYTCANYYKKNFLNDCKSHSIKLFLCSRYISITNSVTQVSLDLCYNHSYISEARKGTDLGHYTPSHNKENKLSTFIYMLMLKTTKPIAK